MALDANEEKVKRCGSGSCKDRRGYSWDCDGDVYRGEASIGNMIEQIVEQFGTF